MCDQSTACNPHWHTQSRYSTNKRVHRLTPDIAYTGLPTDRRWEISHSNTPSARNRAPLTARSSSLGCVSAAEHQTAEQYSKTGKTKPRKHLPRIDLSWNTRQDFLKIPSLWEAALETERRCFSKVIFESNVTPKTTRSSDSFSTVPPIINGGTLGMHCARPQDYRSLGLTSIQFHPPKVTPLTNPAKVTDQGLCATLTPVEGRTAIKVELSA